MSGDSRSIDCTVAGNRLRLLPTGAQRLSAILELIDGAKHDLRLLFYMAAADERGTKVRDALVRAARRGVTIRLLLDKFGCGSTADEFFQPIREAGGDYCIFHPRVGRRYLIRNHQKLLIADGQRGLIGGANITDDYLSDSGEKHWRDLWLRIDGPALGRLAGYFDDVERWTRSRKQRIRDLRRIIGRHSRDKGAVRWLFSGPMRRRNPWPAQLVLDMTAAVRLDIVAAYFAPPRSMIRRIGAVVARGGEARVITAAKSDNNATIAAARYSFFRLLRRGVEIFEYQASRLHTKLYLADDSVHIGSSNFDFRSLFLNLEMMLRVEDPEFAQAMRAYVDGEAASSRRITPAFHRRRASPWRRTKWAMSHFLVTTMDYTVTRRVNFGVE